MKPFLSLMVLIWLALINGAIAADPPPVRIAIIGDVKSQDLSALATADLSGDTTVSLLERDDLAKVGDELKLQKLAGSDAVALGKLLGADGLLFLQEDETGLHMRLTGVTLGYALLDTAFDPNTDPQKMAQVISHQILVYAPKLKLAAQQAIPISILNLRADFARKGTDVLERQLTLLLESRLAAVPEYVVLERRHAWSLGFEHSLNPQASPVLHGAYLIDGSLSLPDGVAGACTASIRIRSPEGRELAVTANGTGDHPSEMADQVLAQIEKAIGGKISATSTTPEKEAEEYLHEAIWCTRNQSPETALEALDSAELLGADVADFEALRIDALTNLLREPIPDWSHGDPNAKPPASLMDELSRRTDLALRAIQDEVHYRDEKLPRKSHLTDQKLMTELVKAESRPEWSISNVIENVSNLLAYLDSVHSPRADELRQAFRAVNEYDPYHGKMGIKVCGQYFRDSRDVDADHWAWDMNEELAFYRLTCTDKVMDLPICLNDWSSSTFCARFLKTPEACQKAFEQFVDSLRDKPDSRMCYLILKTTLSDPAGADAACRDLFDELWKMRVDLATEKISTPLFAVSYRVPREVCARNEKVGLPLLHYLLTSPDVRGYSIAFVQLLWNPTAFPESEAPALWSEYNDYMKRIKLVWSDTGFGDYGLQYHQDNMTKAFRDQFPKIAGPPEGPPPLPLPDGTPLQVTRFWHGDMAPGSPGARLRINLATGTDDGILFNLMYLNKSDKTALLHVSLKDWTTTVVTTPATSLLRALQTTPDYLYICYSDPNEPDTKCTFARRDEKTGEWTTRPAPLSTDRFYVLGNSIYLPSAPAYGPAFLERYDWDTGKSVLLASARRRPAQNQFDDRDSFTIGGIFPGPGGKPCASTGDGTFYIQDQPGNWQKVFESTRPDATSTTLDGRTLLFNTYEALLFDPAKPGPDYLLADSFAGEPPSLDKSPPPSLNNKAPSPWLGQERWKNPTGKMFLDGQNIGMYRDHLIVLLKPYNGSRTCELLWFDQEQKPPRRIPLQFHLDDASRAALSTFQDHVISIDKVEHPETDPYIQLRLIVTGQGLCLENEFSGFWYIPYGDIDGYLKNAPNQTHTP